jgi:hypothetical protein
VLLGDRGSRWRCLLVWASGTSASSTIMPLATPRAERLWAAHASLGAQPLDVALVDVSSCVVVLCAAWAWVALTATVVDAWRGVTTPGRGPCRLPDGVRRVVLAACGVALASGMAAPAGAADGASHRHLHGIALLSGLPLPDRAVAPRRPSGRAGRTVVVHPGDSLWSIAEHDLPPDAPERAVVRHWHAIYAANSSRIGPDPDVIEPGQRLHLPGKDRP